MRPLEDVTVVSLEQAVAAPFASRQLADLGARVIKVERPGLGDFARQYDHTANGMSSYFVWLNRSKESVALDLKTAAGREILEKLIDKADVLMHNLGPGAAGRLGLNPQELAQRHPRLISCRISGWGTDGPWADRKAYDLLVQAEAGLLSLTGSPEHMAKVGISIADIAAGMYAFSGTITALYSRAITGLGTSVDVSLFEALAEWVGQPAAFTAGVGTQPARFGAHHATISPYGPYLTRDQQTILVAVQNDAEWTNFCTEVLGRADLAVDERFNSNADRVANRDVLDDLIATRFTQIDSREATRLLDNAQIARAGVNTVSNLLEHPVLSGRNRWRKVATPTGAVKATLPPIGLTDFEARMDAVPSLGEHTESVLRELGYSESDLAILRDNGTT